MLLVWGTPWFLALYMQMTMNAFDWLLEPLLNSHVILLKLLKLAFVWETGGCLLLLRSSHPAVWTAVVLIFVMPTLLAVLLVPLMTPVLIAHGSNLYLPPRSAF